MMTLLLCMCDHLSREVVGKCEKKRKVSNTASLALLNNGDKKEKKKRSNYEEKCGLF